jgi:hypothetical protein
MRPGLTIILLIFSFTMSYSLNAQVTAPQSTNDTLESRIILIGDAGALVNKRAPVMQAIKERFALDKKTTVIFLGDNIYSEGLPDDQAFGYSAAKAALDSQLALVNGTLARGYFIPGNHDWQNGSANGYQHLQNQQYYIDANSKGNVEFLPRDGCPGPIEVPLSENVTLIIVDSQWWLHPYEKPGIESDCDTKTESEVLSQLNDILARNSKKLVVFASHHPFKSYGSHGGYYTIKEHIFPFLEANPNLWIPLPVIGSIYPIVRSVFGTIQDLKHPAYQKMVNDFQKETKKHQNLIYVAGHEHSLQMIKDSSQFYIGSGSGCKAYRVSKSKQSLFAAERLGFVVMNISKNKNVSTEFFTVGIEGDADTAYASHLLNFSNVKEDMVVNKDTSQPIINYRDSVVVAINSKYQKASPLKRKLLGNNYRSEWGTPVKMAKFNLREEKGGFTIVSLGGGKQTKSLRLKDKNGKEWTLRTATKDPEAVLPENFRNTIAEDVVQDYISASHPYGSLVVPPLAKAVNVVQATPELFFVPDDPALGFYRPLFANTVCFLELREPIPATDDNKSTPNTINKMFEDNDNRVDQESVLRARLLDIVIGDWDRHFDQWRFGETDTGKGKLYYAIPRDRDQAFFRGDGLALKFVAKKLPYLKGFGNDILDVNWFNWEARDFDRIFMSQLDQDDWRKTIASMQAQLSDKVIDEAVKKLPPPIYEQDVALMTSRLKSRRDQLMDEGMKYYEFLSDYVNVLGSNKKENFMISGEGDKVKVNVYKRNSDSDTASLMYSRVFDKKITNEIRLYGLNDDDIFSMADNTPSGIKVRMIGGKGDDTFDINGNAKNFVYDFTSPKNVITHKNKTTVKLSDDPYVNTFKTVENNYNVTRFPMINIAYNAEDKLMVGIGFDRIRHGFKKLPYATRQRLTTLYAPSSGSIRAAYTGEFNEVIAGNDLVLKANFARPVLNNFFGIGNETQNIKGRDFYRVRYNFAEGDVLLRKRMNEYLNFTLGPTIYHYWNHPDDNRNKILENPSLVGLDSVSVFTSKTYAGGKMQMLINNIGNELFPTRGIVWNTELSSLYGLNVRSKPLTKIVSDMTVYGAITDPAKFVGILRVGGGHIFNDNYEYFQALSLGQNNFLRGFRKNRYSGSSLAYGSLEVRAQLFQNKAYVLPGPIGLILFNDVGRVWQKNVDSKRWHYSYGGGFYFVPFNTILLSATVARGEEETLFNLTLGTRFNLTF